METNKNRTFKKFSLETNSWVDVLFEDLVKGDNFRIYDNGVRYISGRNAVWVAKSDAFKNLQGEWTITVLE